MVDENYLRESILDPGAKVVAGYKPVMPTFQGIISEEQLAALVAYVKSLTPGGGSTGELGGTNRHARKVGQVMQLEQERDGCNSYGNRSNAGTTDELPERGAWREVVAAHDRSQTHSPALYAFVTFFFFNRGHLRAANPAGTADPGGRPGPGRYLQPPLQRPRHRDGVLLSDPVVPAILGNFLVPIMVGAKDWPSPASTC